MMGNPTNPDHVLASMDAPAVDQGVVTKLPPTAQRYARLNATWPKPVPPLSEQEAISAAKRLFRLGYGKAWKGKFRLVTGNRHSWITNGVFLVNASGGWERLVHDISHLTHRYLHPTKSGHHYTHIGFERKLTEAVLNKGWLDGGLKRQPSLKPKPDQRAVRYQRILQRIETWEKKKRRTETALAKLYKSKAYYDRLG